MSDLPPPATGESAALIRPAFKRLAHFWISRKPGAQCGRLPTPQPARTTTRSIKLCDREVSSRFPLAQVLYNRRTPRTMKIELSPENAAALAKYAALAGHTPAELLNRYLSDNMVALFENPRSGDGLIHSDAVLIWRTVATKR